MTTRLLQPLKREIEIDGIPYTLTVTPRRLTLVVKGRRKGSELEWSALVNGDAALAAALNASLAVKPAGSPADRAVPRRAKQRKR
jgi:hypothetical protein